MNARNFTLTIFVTFVFIKSYGQDVGAPTLMSQSRTSIANIGNCEITIDYHSPSVNGRKIFGGIVPFDFVVDGIEYPWRAGSNKRTTIEFSHDVEVEGHKLAAGSYGFVALVSEKEWVLIFSKGKSWGAFNYDPVNDVIRIPVKAQAASFQEWLSYEFTHPKAESVDIELTWERTLISFNVTTDAVANELFDISQKDEKSISDYQKLAIYSEDDEVNKSLNYLDEAIKAIPSEEKEGMRRVYEFSTKMLKGEMLNKTGNKDEGNKLKQEALAIAEGFDIYYYALRKYTVEGRKKEAFEILTEQSQKRPEVFQTHIAFGEYYLKEKNQVKAVDHFRKAFELASEQESRWINYTRYLYLQNKLVLENM